MAMSRRPEKSRRTAALMQLLPAEVSRSGWWTAMLWGLLFLSVPHAGAQETPVKLFLDTTPAMAETAPRPATSFPAPESFLRLNPSAILMLESSPATPALRLMMNLSGIEQYELVLEQCQPLG